MRGEWKNKAITTNRYDVDHDMMLNLAWLGLEFPRNKLCFW